MNGLIDRFLLPSALCLSVCAAPAFAEGPQQLTPQQLSELSLEDLLQIRVVTASRTEQPLLRSTSVMTVVTATDIERAGFRTIYDVLARVPGFFPSSQATWKVVGSRGLMADGNDHILLLIDGHPQNSIVAHGFQQQDQIPALEKVERIEIIRGPGSVLWGTSAAHAIVNIVTRDTVPGDERLQLSTGYAAHDGLWTVNVMKSLDMGAATGILSASIWQADGYNAPSGPNVKFPWGAPQNLWPRLDAHDPGFELYVKLRDGDRQQIIARLAQTSVPYPWDSWSYDPSGGVRPGAELRMRKAYLDYRTAHTPVEGLDVEYTFYGDMLLQNRFPLNHDNGAIRSFDTRWIEDQSREEFAFGGEVEATHEFASNHALRIGTKYVHTVAGPNRGFRFDTATNLPTAPAAAEEQVPIIDIPSGRDNTVAVYAEDRLTINGGSTDLFVGARAEYNDWRENRLVALPRAGVIHSLSPNVTAKYVFNTGYLRPNAAYSKSGGKFYRSPSKTIENVNVVDRSEHVYSHDIQLALTRERHHLIGTFFHMTVDNFITWETKLDLGYRNVGTAHSTGVEIEGRYFVGRGIALNGNFSLARGRLREIPRGMDINGVSQLLDGAVTNANREWLNYPTHIWNMGADYIFRTEQSLNVNMRGWHRMHVLTPFTAPNPGSYDTFGGRTYLDASYVAKDIINGLDVRFSTTNLLDNTDPVGMVINNGAFHPRGRNIGVQLTARF